MLYSSLFLAAVAGSTVAAPVLNARYKADILEEYEGYHLRYIALDCQHKHNSTFFDDCCRPVKAGQNATEVLNEYCTPNTTALESAAARIARATATITGGATPSAVDAADDADDAWCSATESVAVSGYSAPTQVEGAIAADSTPTSAAEAPASTSAEEAQPTAEAVNAFAAPESSSAAAPAPSSEAPAPAPTSSEEEHKPEPTSTEEQKPQETPKPQEQEAPKPQENNDDSAGWITGTASWYHQDDGTSYAGQAAACGTRYSDSDRVVALPGAHGFSTGSQGRGCGATVTIKYLDTGKIVTAPAVDACPSCGDNQIDLSRALFADLDNYEKGILNIQWKVDA